MPDPQSSLDVVKNQFLVEQELKAAGLPRLTVAALLGRIDVESGFNPSALNPKDPNDGSFGIFQWNGDRRRRLESFAQRNDSAPEDVVTQARFLAAEVLGKEGAEGGNGKRLIASANAQEAAENVMRLARPSGFTRANPRGGLGFNRTLINTTDYLSATNSPSAREQSPFAAGDTSDAAQRATAKASEKIPGTFVDKLLIGVTEAAANAAKSDSLPTNEFVQPVDIATSQLGKAPRSVTNFLNSLPGVGLGSIRR